MLRIGSSLVAALAMCWPMSSFAQGDGPIDIEFGSGRIGGPGNTTREKRAIAAFDEPEEYLTEDNIPKEGDKKRLPHLHVLAKRYAGGKMFSEACARYDQIITEGGSEALEITPDGKKLAAKSFLGCGEHAATMGKFDKAERLLKKSERYGVSDYRQAAIRRRIKRETYRRKMLNQDVDGAMSVYESYQADREDEDERIWMGQSLTDLAWSAYRAKDDVMLERYLAYAQKVSPRNPDLRKLVDERHSKATVLTNVAIMGAGLLLLLGFFMKFTGWRARRKVESVAGGKMSRKKNKYLDDDDEF